MTGPVEFLDGTTREASPSSPARPADPRPAPAPADGRLTPGRFLHGPLTPGPSPLPPNGARRTHAHAQPIALGNGRRVGHHGQTTQQTLVRLPLLGRVQLERAIAPLDAVSGGRIVELQRNLLGLGMRRQWLPDQPRFERSCTLPAAIWLVLGACGVARRRTDLWLARRLVSARQEDWPARISAWHPDAHFAC